MVTALGLDEATAIDAKIISGSIEGAQKRIESNNFQRRKNVLTYDDVMNQQRNIIYQERHEVLTSDSIRDKIESMIRSSVESTFDFCFSADNPEDYRFDDFISHYRGILTDSRGFKYSSEELAGIDKAAWREELVERALEIYSGKDELFDKIAGVKPGVMREVEKRVLLENVDRKWMDHLEAMDTLKEYIGLNAYAQRDPVAMYRLESGDMFDQMIDSIKEDTVRQILAVVPARQAEERSQVVKVISTGQPDGKRPVRKPVVKQEKVGRNDPCPCGSGKKYKKCCGAGSAAN